MNFRKILRNKRAVSGAIAAVFLIGVALFAVGILYSTLDMSYDSKVDDAGVIFAEDYDRDGLIDTITLPLVNKGISNADIESIVVIQAGVEYLWYSMDSGIDMGSVEEITMYALGVTQQIEPLQTFNVEITFEDSVYTSYGYVVTLPAAISDEVEGVVEPPFVAYNSLIGRTLDDDVYAKKKFPADLGYSPNLWFLVGEFEDDNKKPDLDQDYISLCGNGDEADFFPFLADQREFTEGNIGTQSNNQIIPYNDSGDHPGLVAIDKYGNWDKNDNLNWGKRGIVYMWTYIYNPGTEAVTTNFGANGASEFKIWLNGDYILNGGGKKKDWYTISDVKLNPGLNLVMVKLSAKTNAHFAAQVLFYDSLTTSPLADLYSVWPTFTDL